MQSNENWVSEVERILQENVPDLWDKKNDEYTYYIKYPVLTVTNGRNEEHTMYDLYVRISFISYGALSTISGTRGLLSIAEKESGYAFSHLSTTVTSGNWGGFCFGVGPIKDNYNRLQVEFDATQFDMLILGLDLYLRWESIDGRPYRYMNSIKERDGEPSIPEIYGADLEAIYQRFINKYSSVDFTISFTPFYLKVNPDDEAFMDMLIPLVDDKTVFRDNTTLKYFVGKKSTKSYSRLSLNFTFKGEPVYQEVIKRQENEHEQKLFPNPSISRYVAEKLSRRITLYAANTRTIAKRKASSHTIGGIMVQNI